MHMCVCMCIKGDLSINVLTKMLVWLVLWLMGLNLLPSSHLILFINLITSRNKTSF